MSIKVSFEGWVNEVKTFDWGNVVKVSHNQNSKNALTGEWEVIGKDYLDITVTPEQLSYIRNAKVVKVEGTLKVSTYPKKDGTFGVAMKVWATSIEPVERTKSYASQIPDIAEADMPF
jgi:hypothetical protein